MTKRREILKGLGLALPAVWTAPVVQSVSLPAHAQTTDPEQDQSTTRGNNENDDDIDPGPACQPLLIPGASVSCPSDGSGVLATQHRVDDSGVCPALRSTAGFDATPAVDVVQVERWRNSNVVNNVGISVRTSRGNYSQFTLDCGSPGSSTGNPSQTLTFQSSSGAMWQAEFDLNRSSTGTVTLGNIALSPVVP